MNEHLKSIAKISGKSIWGWIKVNLLGGFFLFVNLAIGFFLLADNAPSAGFGGHAGGPAAILVLFMVLFYYLSTDLFPTLLIVFAFISIPLFFLLANKYAISTFLYNIYQNKLSDFIETKLQVLLKKVFDKYPKLFEQANWKSLSVKLIQESKHDKSMSWINRKSIAYGLKKISLDEVDFADPNLSLSQVISQKIKLAVNDTLEPSLKPVWIIFGLDLVFIILAFIFNNHK